MQESSENQQSLTIMAGAHCDDSRRLVHSNIARTKINFLKITNNLLTNQKFTLTNLKITSHILPTLERSNNSEDFAMSTTSEKTKKTSIPKTTKMTTTSQKPSSSTIRPTGFWPGCQAPTFHDVPCLREGEATTLDLSTLQGKPVLLLFYPVDFGYIAPTELELLNQLGSECELVAISTGSLVSKVAFLNTPRYTSCS